MRTLHCDQMLVSSLLQLQPFVTATTFKIPIFKAQHSSSLISIFWLFNLAPLHAPFHHSFQPLPLLPSFPSSLIFYFLLCRFLYLKQPLIFKATKSSENKNSPLKCLALVSYTNNTSVVLIHIPIYLLWSVLEINCETRVCGEYCVHLLSSLELLPEQSVILQELGGRI